MRFKLRLFLTSCRKSTTKLSYF
ncbi:MAG: hypothetical protein DCF14_16420 [Phormidesmis priestleyi]|nr:MAG: hypothetical protein DCF14_16420 [Phormidesmis priestleyi]